MNPSAGKEDPDPQSDPPVNSPPSDVGPGGAGGHDGPDAGGSQPAAQACGAATSRRDFIRKVGAFVFAATVVDLTSTLTPTRGTVAQCTGTVKDQTCTQPGHNDQGCVLGATDPDQGCSATNRDDACFIRPRGPSSAAGHDPDASCGMNGVEPDNSCGDCDDNHDSDNHCNQPLASGATDPDDLCGHQHLGGQGHEDQVCGTNQPGGPQNTDVGCGVHETSYGTWNDPDNYCAGKGGNPGNPDANCTNNANGDATCGRPSNPSTTSPDETCGPTNAGNVDPDGACNRYDKDQSCGSANSPTDEGCGAVPSGLLVYLDTDGNCAGQSPTGGVSPDFSCGLPTDRWGNKDSDQSCQVLNSDHFNNPWPKA